MWHWVLFFLSFIFAKVVTWPSEMGVRCKRSWPHLGKACYKRGLSRKKVEKWTAHTTDLTSRKIWKRIASYLNLGFEVTLCKSECLMTGVKQKINKILFVMRFPSINNSLRQLILLCRWSTWLFTKNIPIHRHILKSTCHKSTLEYADGWENFS